MEYKFWRVWYVSCESNTRWLMVRTPSDWVEEQVRDRIPIGGCGDDIAEISSIEETGGDANYSWDFCDE